VIASAGAQAAVFEVAEIDIAAMTFSLTASRPGRTCTVTNPVPAADTNVVDGPRNPSATFDLSLDTS
jgi:hypothetical protein